MEEFQNINESKNSDDGTLQNLNSSGSQVTLSYRQVQKPVLRVCFKEKFDNERNFKGIEMKYNLLHNILKSFGFARLDVDEAGSSIFIQIKHKVVRQVSRQVIIDTFMEYLEEIDYSSFERAKKDEVINKVLNSISTYFNNDFLDRLTLEQPIQFNKDTRTQAFFYFQNGFVKCDATGRTFHDYQNLEKHIWKKQIIVRQFTYYGQDGVNNEEMRQRLGCFADFVWKVSNQDDSRYEALCSLIGYLLHGYTDQKLKACIFTDSEVSEAANGRTGKTILAKAVGKMRSYTEINGKDFDPMVKHKYQELTRDTQVVHLNDVRKNFDIEMIYNDITEGMKVEGKSKQPFTVVAKMCISTNKTIRIEGASARDRVNEYEFSNFFSDKHSPEDEYGHWFFSDWDQTEWSKFDNFMIHCTSLYLEKGIIKCETINLATRKLLDQTAAEFLEFMDDCRIEFDHRYEIKSLFRKFLDQYPDYATEKTMQRKFTEWLIKYTKFSPDHEPYDVKNKAHHYTKSNNDTFFTFRRKTKPQNTE